MRLVGKLTVALAVCTVVLAVDAQVPRETEGYQYGLLNCGPGRLIEPGNTQPTQPNKWTTALCNACCLARLRLDATGLMNCQNYCNDVPQPIP